MSMTNEMYEKFNNMFDMAGLKADIEAAKANNTEFEKVPYGDYEVRVEKIELGATGEKSKTPGAPMAKIWYTIVAGDYKNQKLFQNQMLTGGFGIHMMNEFLDSLESGYTCEFENYVQYADLFRSVFEAIKADEYQLSYGQNNKGYDIYKIVQKF